LLRWLTRRISRRERGGSERAYNYSPEVLELFRRAEEALSRVEVPGYDMDLVSAGVVKRLRLSNGRLIVFLDYYGTDPSCFFCRFINQAMWNTILSKASKELAKAGIENVEFVDYYTGLRLEYNKEW